MEKKPYRVGIIEKYIKEVIIFAEDPAEAEELAEDLCNQAVIELDYDNFVSRDTENWGQAQLPADMQIFDAYGTRKHISEVQKGDTLIYGGQLLTALEDSRLAKTAHGEDWTVQLKGADLALFVYTNYFPEGMVNVAQPAFQHEIAPPEQSAIHTPLSSRIHTAQAQQGSTSKPSPSKADPLPEL